MSRVDGHAWCENKDGEVVFDPSFKEYKFIKMVNKLEGENQYEIVPELSGKVMACIKIHIKDFKKNNKMSFENIMKMFLKYPKFNCCFLNAYAYKFANPEVKLMVGKMGWKKKNSGEIFWEYG
tara:strand:- start:4528 stop:4896 length:369 start_codon:yes stop_codon:yes gene_type:complete